MRIIFAGTPAFAAEALRRIVAAGHCITLVLTQPDRPAGRGMKLTASAVATAAQELELPIAKLATLRDAKAEALVRAERADLMVVAAYGLLLPTTILTTPKFGCINIHASLLPRWRGAAPIQRAIEAGDTITGISIMQMDAGLDTGPVLLSRTLSIEADETSASLFEKLTVLGAEAVVDAMTSLASLVPSAQPAEGVCYARKIEKSEAVIDWAESARLIERRVRAFDPFPGAELTLGTERLKVWGAQAVSLDKASEAGTVIGVTAADVTIACREGALRITHAQRVGGRRLPMREILRSLAISTGQVCK